MGRKNPDRRDRMMNHGTGPSILVSINAESEWFC